MWWTTLLLRDQQVVSSNPSSGKFFFQNKNFLKNFKQTELPSQGHCWAPLHARGGIETKPEVVSQFSR